MYENICTLMPGSMSRGHAIVTMFIYYQIVSFFNFLSLSMISEESVIASGHLFKIVKPDWMNMRL